MGCSLHNHLPHLSFKNIHSMELFQICSFTISKNMLVSIWPNFWVGKLPENPTANVILSSSSGELACRVSEFVMKY